MKILFSKKERCSWKKILAFIIFIIIFFPVLNTEAVFNKQINYQGKLTTSAGVAVANGSYNVEFKLMTVSSGGDTTQGSCTTSCVWIETRTGGNQVTVTNGLFSVLLGEVTSLSGVDFNQTLYLTVRIGGTGTPAWDGEMTPRKKLGAVPAAVVSEKTSNLIAGVAGAIPYQSAADTTAFSAAGTTGQALISGSTGSPTWFAPTAGSVLFSGASGILSQDNANFFWDATNHRLGIGTTNPVDKLDVAGAILTSAPLVAHQTSRGVFEYNAGKVAIRAYGATAGTGFIAFNTGGGGGSADSEKVRIDTAGNVGIGTTVPGYNLDVQKASGNDATIRVLSPNAGAWYYADSATDGYNALRLAHGGTVTWNIGQSAGITDFAVANSSDGITNRFLTVKSTTGNVGIGLTDPGQPLDIFAASDKGLSIRYGSDTASRNWGFVHDLSVYGDFGIATSSTKTAGLLDTYRMYFDPSGKVGIGKTNPGTALDVNGTVTATSFSGAGTGLTGTAASLTAGFATNANDSYGIAVSDATTMNPGFTSSIGSSGSRSVDLAPNTYNHGIFSEFKNGSWPGFGTGTYNGLVTIAPWVGTTASTGDSSYQLRFAPASTNSTAVPSLAIRAGIDTTWGSWATLMNSSNVGTYAVSSIAGTANQITASASTGAVTLSIPSDFRAPGTVNAVTGLYTGAGAGTQRIDASGNLVNIGNITATGPTTQFSNDYPIYRWSFGGSTDLAWKTIANVTATNGSIYEGVSFVINISDANTNNGGVVTPKILRYVVSMTGPTSTNTALVSGPIADYVRVVRTSSSGSTNVYELQVRQVNNYANMDVDAQINSTCCVPPVVAYVTSPVNGSTSGTIYNAAVTDTNYLTNANVAGTLTLSNLTAGSIPFAGAAGVIAQDNANLFWDNTNKRLGIGIASPTALLNIKAGTATANTEPIQLTAGVLNSTAVSGALETDASNNLYYTNGVPTRGQIPLATAANTLFFTTTGATNVTLPTSGTLATNSGSNWTFASQAIGDLAYATSTTAYGRLADVATGSYLASGGTGTAPAWATLNQAAVAGLTTGSSPTFTGLNLSGLTASKVVFTDASKNLTSTGIGTSSQFIKGDGSLDSSTYLTSLSGAWLLNGNTNGTKKTLGSIDNYDIGFLTNNTERMTILAGGNVGIGTTSPTAYLNIKAGTATANTEPIQLTAGVLNSTAVSGALETDASNNLYYTNGVPTRGQIPLATAANTLFFTTTGATNVTLPTSGTLATNSGSNWTFASQAIGDLAYATSTTAYGRLADVAVGSYLRSGGAGTAPAWATLNQAAVAGLTTGSSPTFTGLNLSGLTASKVVFTDASKNLTSTGIGTSSQFIKGDGSLDSSTYALNNQTMYIGTTAQAINRGSAAEGLTGITGLTPGADFTLTQNSVAALTSVESGAVANTLYLKAGNVGIGTTSPTNILSLGNGAAQKFWIENTATDVVGRALTVAAGGTVAGTSVSNVVGGQLILQSGLGTGTGDSSIAFQTGTTLTTGTTLQTMSTKMTLLGNGNLGIGTTAPGQKLVIASGKVLINETALNTNDPSPNLEVEGTISSNNATGGNPTFEFADQNWRWFRDDTNSIGPQYSLFTTGSGAGARQFLWRSVTSDVGNRFGSYIGYAKAASGIENTFFITPTINQSGAAGYTGLLLNVTETTTGSGLKLLQDWQVGGVSKMVIDNTGNVGIGTTSPTQKLQVWDGSADIRPDASWLTTEAIQLTQTGDNPSIRLYRTVGDSINAAPWYIQNTGDTFGDLEFMSGNNAAIGSETVTAKMTILKTGEVGIGTTAPQKILNTFESGVTDAATIHTGLQINADYGTNAATVSNAGGKWGITFNGAVPGTTSTTKLAGIYAVSEDATAGYNRKVGLSFLTTHGADTNYSESMRISDGGKVGIGTTSPTQNLDMVAGGAYGYNGQQVITALTTGYDYFLGNSGNLTMTGTYNTSEGYTALHADTTGYNNTAQGAEALYANTTGSNNTAQGMSALTSNTSGVSNTAQGTSALAYNNTGYQNSAQGTSALYANTTGYQNSASGAFTLYYNSTGNQNSAFGSDALYYNSTGSGNSAFGMNALHDLNITANDGSGNNTAVGYGTGGGIVTGVNNTIIGANVTGLSSALSNNIIIADGAGNQRINVDNNGNVGIGTTSPGESLHVNPTTYGVGKGFYLGTNFTGGTAGTTGLSMYLSAASGGYAGVQSVQSSGSTYGNLILNLNGGKIGIGTASPTNILSLSGAAAQTIWMERANTSNAGQGLTISSGGAYLATTDLAGGDLNLKSGISTGAGASAMHFFTATAGTTGITDRTPTEKMTILGSGNVGIGTTSPGNLFQVTGTPAAGTWVAQIDNTTGGAQNNAGLLILAGSNAPGSAVPQMITFERPDATVIGTITQNAATTIAFNTSSDQRIKQDITPTSYGLADLMKINVEDFSFISDPTKQKMTGFIAQNLYGIFPGAVTTNGDNGTVPLAPGETPWMVDYSKVTPLIVKSIQDMNISLEGIDKRVAALEDSNTKNTNFIASMGGYASDFFSAGVESVVDGVVYMKDMVVEKLTVGSPTKRTGITLYDEATGSPNCFSIMNGMTRTTLGECTVVEAPATTPSGTLNSGVATSIPTTYSPTDAKAPIITLDGDVLVSLNVGASYNEPGAVATDPVDGQVATIISGSVNTAVPGTYKITYNATDRAGNHATEVTRTVVVGPSVSSGSTPTTTTPTLAPTSTPPSTDGTPQEGNNANSNTSPTTTPPPTSDATPTPAPDSTPATPSTPTTPTPAPAPDVSAPAPSPAPAS